MPTIFTNKSVPTELVKQLNIFQITKPMGYGCVLETKNNTLVTLLDTLNTSHTSVNENITNRCIHKTLNRPIRIAVPTF